MIIKDLNPSNVKALYWSSFALFKLEKYNEALENAKRGIELEPANKDLRKLYAEIKQMVEIKNDAWKAHMSGIMNRDEFKTALEKDEDDAMLKEKIEKKRSAME